MSESAAPPDPVERWVRAARAGSHADLGLALEACRPYLLHVANAELAPQLRPKGGASDLVQETFLEAHRLFDRFQGTRREELHAWLRAILANKVATFSRQYLGTEKRHLGREESLAGAPTTAPADSPTPSTMAARREVEAAVALALDRLPEDYRQVIRWRQWEGLPFDEIARRLGRGVDAARMVWWRAIDRLQNELGAPP